MYYLTKEAAQFLSNFPPGKRSSRHNKGLKVTDCPGSATIRRQLRRVQKVSPDIFQMVLEGKIPSANLAFNASELRPRSRRRFIDLVNSGEDPHVALSLARDGNPPPTNGDAPVHVLRPVQSPASVERTSVPATEHKAMQWYQESVSMLDSWPRGGASLRTLHTLALAFQLLVGDRHKEEQV